MELFQKILQTFFEAKFLLLIVLSNLNNISFKWEISFVFCLYLATHTENKNWQNKGIFNGVSWPNLAPVMHMLFTCRSQNCKVKQRIKLISSTNMHKVSMVEW